MRRWLLQLFKPHGKLPSELQRASAMLDAIDAGGVPLNPAKINEIARSFGLEVSKNAPVEITIQRIRDAVNRAATN
jgi:hypothetical protein